MATREVVYIPYVEAVLVHIELMRDLGETHYGVFSRDLVASALNRPQQAAVYDNADLIQQAATLLYGLIKNHPWVGGNKRTGTALTQLFLKRNGLRIVAPVDYILELVTAVEDDEWRMKEIDAWLRAHVVSLGR